MTIFSKLRYGSSISTAPTIPMVQLLELMFAISKLTLYLVCHGKLYTTIQFGLIRSNRRLIFFYRDFSHHYLGIYLLIALSLFLTWRNKYWYCMYKLLSLLNNIIMSNRLAGVSFTLLSKYENLKVFLDCLLNDFICVFLNDYLFILREPQLCRRGCVGTILKTAHCLKVRIIGIALLRSHEFTPTWRECTVMPTLGMPDMIPHPSRSADSLTMGLVLVLVTFSLLTSLTCKYMTYLKSLALILAHLVMKPFQGNTCICRCLSLSSLCFWSGDLLECSISTATSGITHIVSSLHDTNDWWELMGMCSIPTAGPAHHIIVLTKFHDLVAMENVSTHIFVVLSYWDGADVPIAVRMCSHLYLCYISTENQFFERLRADLGRSDLDILLCLNTIKFSPCTLCLNPRLILIFVHSYNYCDTNGSNFHSNVFDINCGPYCKR